MSNKDTDNAAKLLIVWFIVFMTGLVIANECNRVIGLSLSISATIIAIVIVYCDWRNEQTKNRLDNYIDAAGKRIEEVTHHRTRENFRE